MDSITMTGQQTSIYDAGGEAARTLMATLRTEAQAQADRSGNTVEIYTQDGIVADALQPRTLGTDEHAEVSR